MKKMRIVFLASIIFVTIPHIIYGLDLYARVSAAWNVGTTWSIDGITSCGCTPTSTDNVLTNGFLISVPTGSFSVNNLFISSAQNGSLFKSGLNSATITIFGELASYSGAIGAEAFTLPAGPIITITRLNFVFNGTAPVGTSIIEPGAWGPLAPLPSFSFSPVAPGTPLSIDAGVAIGTGAIMTISTGTLNINAILQSATSSATITINSGATLVVNSGSITGSSGDNTTKFPTLTINGTLTSQSNSTSFINADIITAGATGVLNVGYNGANQTQGWWYQSISPSTFTADPASTINYNSSTSQNVLAQSYGNLTLGGTGALTKTVSGIGSINIKGTLSFSNTSITFTASSSNQVIFDGTGAQSITGGGTANFNGGLQVNKSVGITLTLSQGISIQNGLTLTIGTINFGSNTVNLAGNLVNNATLAPAGSTLNITGTTAVSGSSTTSLNNLTISGTGNLTAPATPATLNIAGNFTNNGVFNASTGNLVFNGAAAQSIGGTTASTFYDITTSNSVTVSTAQNISGVLAVNLGTFTTGGLLTLLSTASGDAMIGQVGGTISGNVNVQRYLPNTAAVSSYRYLSSPVTGATVAAWKIAFPITGTFTDPSTQAEWPAIPGIVQTSPSMYLYNESKGGLLGARYDTYPINASSTAASALTNGTGYAAYVRQTAPITTLTVTGAVRQGNNVTVPVTNLAGDATNDGWNLIGNPFPAPINWNGVTKPAGVSAGISLKDNTGNFTTAGSFVTISGGVSNPPGLPDAIPSGEAFWVRYTTAGSVNIVFKEADKVIARNPTFLRQETISSIVRAKLSGNGRQDELAIRLVDGASDKADNSYDGYKLKNDYLSFSSLTSDGLKMAINAGALFSGKQVRESKIFPLVVEGNGNWALAGNYKVSFSEMETFGSDVTIVLKDALKNDSLVVTSQTPDYSFAITKDSATFINRFKLIISRSNVITALSDELHSNQINVYPNPTEGVFTLEVSKDIAGRVKALNSLGVELGEIEMKDAGKVLSGQFDLRGQSSGIYFILVSDGAKVYTRKVIKN